MFKTIFYREVLDNVLGRRFYVILVLCLLIIPLGVYVGTRDYQVRRQAYQEITNLYSESHKSGEDILFHGAKVYHPPSSFSFLSLGLEIIMPNLAETRSEGTLPQSAVELRFDSYQTLDNIYEFIYGPLDLVFIVTVMMTLFAIALTYGSLSGEKEQGTLKQILCNAVPRGHVLLAKMAANYIVLIIPFFAAILLGLLLFASQGISLSGIENAWFSLGLAVVFSALLVGAFFNLGMLISSLTRQAVSTIIILLLCWVVLYGVVPRLSMIVAELVSPVRSPQLIAFEKNRIRMENEKECDARINELIDSGQDSPERQKTIQAEYRGKLLESWQKIDREKERRRNAQIAVGVNLARLSPVSCFVRPLVEISRTGWLEYQEFIGDVSRYQQILNDKIYGKRIFQVKKGGGQEIPVDNLSGPAPLFQAHAITRLSLISNVLPDLILLVIYNVLFMAGAFVKFLRYDVR
jgi:ABC-type transport system involved in multi-copper enzyme maturation permease subunit